jgi:SAM-dependent methyltransferase
MSERRQSALRSIGHNLELYATLAVCGFLIVLKILHVVEEQWIYSAILVTLMLLALGSLRDRADDMALRRSLERFAAKSNDEGGLRWYTLRADATADMLADMGSFRHMVFLGVSHRQLPGYLRDKLQCAVAPLPWETVDVYFASDLLGEAYEGANFHRNLAASRQEIAGLLSDPAYADRLPHLRSISFYQNKVLAAHTGSLFGCSTRELAVIYAVHSAVHLHGDTHHGLTIRLSACPGLGVRDGRFEYYDGVYRALSQSSVSLGVFARSIWDRSATRWTAYARQSKVLARSAAIVAERMSPQSGDSVLDIGSGSGNAARAILEHHSGISMVLLEGSPQMVGLLRNEFRHDSLVRVALCQLPVLDGSGVDLGQDEFSFIVIHESLGELVRSFRGLDQLAAWCRGRLRPGGQVLVAAHNTLVEAAPPPGFENWQDPFRAELARRLKKKKLRPLRNPPRKLERAEITNAFLNHGLRLEELREEAIEMDYEERRCLWKVPAVMGSMIDGSETATEELDRLVDEVIDELRGQRTMPRTVVFWRFAS